VICSAADYVFTDEFPYTFLPLLS